MMNIYRVAICDNDSAMLDNLCALCREILDEEETNCTITAFAGAEKLKESMDAEQDAFDLLILDAQMNGMTGMELAYSLRARGNRISIIFITACEKYLLEGYGVQPIHFLLKPIKKEALANALRIDLRLNYLPKTVLLHIGSKSIRLSLADIRYVESSNHQVIIHRGG